MPEDGLTFYGSCVVAPCRPVLVFLAEQSIPYHYEEVNILKGEHLTAEFLEKNPKHTLPLIGHKGQYISEGPAILSYLYEEFQIPRPPCSPQIYQLLSWSAEQLHWDIGFSYVYPQIYSELGCPDQEENNRLIETGIGKVCKDLDVLEKEYLAKQKWLLGEHRTLADTAVACIVVILELVLFDFRMWPRVTEWLALVRDQPHWEDVHKFHDEVVQKIRAENSSTSSSETTANGSCWKRPTRLESSS